jgi:hypothetical protein
LTHLGSNRTERKIPTCYAGIAKGTDCRGGSSPDLYPVKFIENKKACYNSRLSRLTHLGSNQDSAEPKSDVLPITPWVIVVKRAAKLGIFL